MSKTNQTSAERAAGRDMKDSTKAAAGTYTIREFHAVDGYFVLISDEKGELFAKAYDPRKAKLIAAVPALLRSAQAQEEFWARRERELGDLSEEARALRALNRAALSKVGG